MEERIRFSAEELTLSPITESDKASLSDFYCGSKEIDDFLHEEIFLCAKYKYLIPYKCMIKSSGEIAGIFTLANDILTLDYEDKIEFAGLPNEYNDIFQRQSTYPAINIGHLAVKSQLQRRGIGRFIAEFVRMSFTDYRGAGCQFVTVDALNNHNTISFYLNLGFDFQTVSDCGKSTRRMFLEIFSHPL